MRCSAGTVAEQGVERVNKFLLNKRDEEVYV